MMGYKIREKGNDSGRSNNVKDNPILTNSIIKENPLKKECNTNNKKIITLLLFLVTALVLADIASADLYLNSRTGSIYLNTTDTARMQITPGGNLILLGNANASIPGNLSVATNVLFVDSTSGYVGIGTTSPSQLLDVSGTSTFGGDLAVPSHDINVGGGYSGGGITLIGQETDKGTGQFAGNIMLDGAIVAVYDVEINRSFIPDKDKFSILGNVTNRWLDLFVINIKSGNETLSLNANVSVAGNLTVLNGLNVTGGIRVSELASCTNDIETDAEGNFFCGSADAVSVDTDALDIVNTSMLDNGSIIRTGNVTNIMVGNTSWAITAVNDSIKDYYNHSIDLSGYVSDVSSYQKMADAWNWANNASLVLDNGSIARMNHTNLGDLNITGNFSAGEIYLGSGSNADQSICFYYDGDTCGKSIFLDGDTGYIHLGGNSYVDGTLSVTSTAYLANVWAAADIHTTGSGDDLWLGTATQGSSAFRAYASGDLYITGTLNTSVFKTIDANITNNLTIANNITFTNLINCDVLATDANGVPYCDSDVTGGDTTNLDIVNQSMLDNSSVVRLNTSNVGNLNITGNFIVNTSVLFVDSTSGYVGIGTTEPSYPLNVVGEDAVVAWDGDSCTGVLGATAVEAGVYGEGNTYGVYGGGDTGVYGEGDTYGVYGYSEEGTAGYFISDGGGYGLIVEDGNVGIGTTSPSSSLEVNGNLTVSGKTNSTLGNFSIGQYNASCAGFRFGTSGGWVLSCD